MDWVLSIIREGDGFRLVDDFFPYPKAVGCVSMINGQLHAELSAPIDAIDAKFLGHCICDHLTASGRIPQITAVMRNMGGVPSHSQFGY